MSQGFVTAYSYVLSAGLSYLAARLSRPKVSKAKADDFVPTTLASQGSRISRLWGKRRIGHVFAWAGDRQVIPYAQGTVGGGKGGSSKKSQQNKTPVYIEAGWHLLCVGPAKRLTKIWADGKVIWSGDLNSTDDPSGTAVPLGNGDEFEIYWGEVDQPTNTFLGASSRVNVTSRWPYHCYVLWTQKGLGPSPRWPQMEYELEVECELEDELANAAGGYIDGSGDSPAKPSGVNPAHVLAELLFQPFPHGLGLAATDWDLSFLEAFAEEANALRLPASIYAADGETAESVIARIMQDHGLFLRWSGQPSTESTDILDGLEAYYPFDEDDWLADKSGNGRDLVETGTNSDIDSDGKVGTCALLGGSTSHYIGRPVNDPALNFNNGTHTTDFTIAFWVKPQSLNAISGPTQTLLAKWEPSGGYSLQIAHTDSRIQLETDKIFLTVINGTITAGQWNHVVLRRYHDNSPPAGQNGWRMWINGVQGPNVDTGSSQANFLATSYPLKLGIRDNARPSNAYMDEVAIWSRPLSETEIAYLYNGGVGRSLSRTVQGWQFVRLREACLADELSDGLPAYLPAPAGMLASPLPEIEVNHAERGATQVVFAFNDANRDYRQSTIAVGDDAQAFYLEYQRAQNVDLPTVIDFQAAAVLAARRGQEELGAAARYVFAMNRGARAFLPGDRISVSGYGVLRVVQVELEQHGGARVQAVFDSFSVPASGYEPADGSSGGTAGPTGTPLADLAFGVLEVPAHLLGAPGTPPAIVVPRIRANADQTFADLWISPDGTTYTLTERETDLQAGGELVDAIDAADPWVIESEPTFDALGVDIGNVEDLSSNEANWRAGLQLCLIDNEIFFLRAIELVSGTTYKLKGLIRARYDSQRAAHSAGAKVYIFAAAEIQFVQHPLLQPGTNLRVKTQPYSGTALSLASVTAVSRTLAGKGIVPMRPAALRVTAPVKGSASFRAGQDVSLAWAHRSTQVPGTGAGLQGAGVATGISPLLPGEEFELQFLTTGDVLKKTVTQSSSAYTYTNADLVTDFGGEPSEFKVQVRQVNGGYRSDPVELTVTRIT